MSIYGDYKNGVDRIKWETTMVSTNGTVTLDYPLVVSLSPYLRLYCKINSAGIESTQQKKVADDCEKPCGCWEVSLAPLQECKCS